MSPTVVKSRPKETPEEKKSRVLKIIGILDRTYPDTRLALNFTTPLELLIALILAAQCTDERVNQVTATLFKKYRAPKDWAGLDRDRLEAEIRSTGFYRNKAKSHQPALPLPRASEDRDRPAREGQAHVMISEGKRAGSARSLFCSLAGHGDEGDGEECGLLKTRLAAPDQHQALGVLLAKGQDQPPAEGELIQERLRDVVRCGGDEDRVVGGVLRPTLIAVAGPHLHVRVAQLLQLLSGLVCQRLHDLDGEHIAHEFGQDRRLVA